MFDMMRMLQKQNVAIVFISHKLKEVMEVCNRYTVLRDGNMVAAGPVAEVTTADLARFMVGHDVRTENLHQDKELGGEIPPGRGPERRLPLPGHLLHRPRRRGAGCHRPAGRRPQRAVPGRLRRPALHRAALCGGSARQGDLHPQAIRLGIGYVPATARRTASSRTWISWRTAPWSPFPGWPAGASSTSAAGTRSLTAR